MQITILGVSRPIGAHAAKKALDNGHVVFVLVRRGIASVPDSVKKHPNAQRRLNVLEGDATNPHNLKDATQGSDAVLSFLGGRGKLKTTVVGDSTKELVAILPPTVIFVLISNVGVGESRKYQNFILKHVLLDRIMPGILKDKLDAETTLASSNIIKWTALRVGRLTDHPEDLENVQFVEVERAKITRKVSREDVAAVALKLVEDGYEGKYWGRPICIESGQRRK